MCPDGTEPAAPGGPNYCTNCGARLLPDSNFCTSCGKPQKAHVIPPQPVMPYGPYVPPPPKNSTAHDVIMGFGSYSAAALAVLMAVNVVIAIWAVGQVWPHMDKHVYLFVITPFIVNFAELGGGAFMGYYIFLVTVITACFAWMMYKSLRPLASELQVKYPQEGHSPLYTMATLLFAVLSFNVIYYFLIEATGASATTPSFDTRELWQLIYGFAEASVWEEVVSRILLIGVPLLIIDALLRMKNPDYKMKRVPRYILGGGFTIGRKEALLMVFSSLMFGTAHVFAWDAFKVLGAAVAGLAFAYLYLRIGLYASIMLHFATDFMTVPLSVWPDATGVTLVVGLLVLVWLFVGVPYMVLYFSKGAGWLLGRRIWPDLPPAVPKPPVFVPYYPVYASPAPVYYPAPQPAPPAPYQSAPLPQADQGHAYVCPNCGNREAVYTDGRLVCTRCGSKR
ncbi:MAG: CPBP family glutamic-type intramembrane protease [Methanomassiliicoccus sp.]|nr:CPBP family glutamic-type intramembrane protease [Methanomassiliicoccus sp.]